MKKILKLPIYLLIAGIINRIVTIYGIRFLVGLFEIDSYSIFTYYNGISIAVFIVSFICIGLMVRNNYSRKECFLSVSIIFVYTLLAIGIEQMAYKSGNWELGFRIGMYMFIPMEIFNIVYSLLMKYIYILSYSQIGDI